MPGVRWPARCLAKAGTVGHSPIPIGSSPGNPVSGRKQHFIPQALQRGFTREIRGTYRVWVHHRERGVYESNVADVAASRDFYSEPALEAGPRTLDDRITG